MMMGTDFFKTWITSQNGELERGLETYMPLIPEGHRMWVTNSTPAQGAWFRVSLSWLAVDGKDGGVIAQYLTLVPTEKP